MTQAKSPGGTLEQFRERIKEDLALLYEIRAGLELNTPPELSSVRSIATAIAEAARENWFEGAARAATALRDATESEISTRIEALLDTIGNIPEADLEKVGRRIVLVGEVGTAEAIQAHLPDELTFEWSSFDTARDAEQYIERHAVSLIVSNVVLADIDGRQFLKRIRRNGRATRCPILVIAPGSERIAADLFDLGATDVLSLPLDTEILARLILDHAIQGHSPSNNTDDSTGTAPDGFLDRHVFARKLERATTQLRSTDQPLWFGKLLLENLAGKIEGHENSTRSEIFRKTARLIHSQFGDHVTIGCWKRDEIVLMLGGDSGNNLNQRLERLVRTLSAQPYAVHGDSPFQIGYSCAVVHIGADDTLHEAVVRVNRLLADRRLRSLSPVIWNDTAYRPPIRRLLLVVPENLVPDVIRTVLEGDNFASVHANSLFEGVHRLEENQSFELIVVDAGLNGSNGRSPVAVICDSLGEQRPGIVAVVGGGDAGELKSALAEGADDFIVKPFSALDFLGRLYLLLMTKEKTMDESEKSRTLPAGTLIDALVRAIRAELLDGSAVDIPGLGSFQVAYHESTLEEDSEGRSFLQPPHNTISFTPELEA